MIVSTTELATENALDYLGQLHHHFAKRVPVQGDETSIRVTLPIGTCDLAACDKAISAHVETCADHVDRMEEVFGGWIERFAFRENANLTWQRAMIPNGD